MFQILIKITKHKNTLKLYNHIFCRSHKTKFSIKIVKLHSRVKFAKSCFSINIFKKKKFPAKFGELHFFTKLHRNKFATKTVEPHFSTQTKNVFSAKILHSHFSATTT